MTTLAALVAELQSEVPAVNSVPTTAQYEQAVKDAVLDFSRRCGLGKWAELSIISGTATYNLPADFLKMITLEILTGVDGTISADRSLIAVSSDWEEEQWTIANKVITFVPTPQYTLTRDYKYKAAWVLTGSSGSETYAAMGDDEAQIVMIKAKSLAKEKLANKMASAGGMKYSLGAVSVDKGSGVEALTSEVYKLHGQFVEECEGYNGAAMSA